MALGYVASRTVEAVVYGVDTIVLLTLLTVGRDFVDSGAPDASHFQTLGDTLLAARDRGGHVVLDVAVFPMSALILNFALYRARLVPRMLSVWGLVGAILYMAAGVMVLYGLEPLSTTQVALDVPLGVQELALAGWLIVRGFDAPPAGSLRTEVGPDDPELQTAPALPYSYGGRRARLNSR